MALPSSSLNLNMVWNAFWITASISDPGESTERISLFVRLTRCVILAPKLTPGLKIRSMMWCSEEGDCECVLLYLLNMLFSIAFGNAQGVFRKKTTEAMDNKDNSSVLLLTSSV